MSLAAPTAARLRDVPALVSILRGFGREVDWLPQRRSRLTDFRMMSLLVRRGQVRVLHGARGPLGFIARDGARIHALYVSPRGRRQGAGRRLLDEAKQHCDWLELWAAEANEAARRFYAREGFAEGLRGCGAGNDENIPDIHMVWQRAGAGLGERHVA